MNISSFKAIGLALLLSSASPMAEACGYDGLLPDIAPAHSDSLLVALAIFDAYENELMRKPMSLPGGFGLRRALGLAEKTKVALEHGTGVDGFHMLMVESGLWTYYQPSGDTLKVIMHAPKPAEDQAMVITGEGVLLALQSGKLSVAQAMAAGMLRIEAAEQQRERISQRWQQAMFSQAQAN